MRRIIISVVGLLCVTGCATRTSSLLLERQSKGQLDEEVAIAQAMFWTLDPVLQNQTQSGVEMTVNYASPKFLKNFFSNKAIFGTYAGPNPYYPEHLVFYVKIANRGSQKIRIDPTEFVLLDDRGNQYSTVSTDYITAFAEHRKPMATTTRGLLESASPGYFGINVPVGKLLAAKPQGQFALLQHSALQIGYLYPGVIHDGLIAFWNPSAHVHTLQLLTNIKTDFDAGDLPKSRLEYTFKFTVDKP